MRDDKPSRVTSRSEKVGKKRKANSIYNILLVVVIIAIIIVGASIFLGNEDKESASPKDQISNEEKNNDNDKGTTEDKNESKTDDESNDDSKTNDDEVSDDNDGSSDEEDSDEMKKPKEEDKVVENSGDSTVEETRVNDSWEPVGTEQKGQHVTKYDSNSVDWKEMEKALAYGSGIAQGDMTIEWLGNGGAPNKAVGTVRTKDRSAKYKVYIEWVDGSGWKPSKVEKLK